MGWVSLQERGAELDANGACFAFGCVCVCVVCGLSSTAVSDDHLLFEGDDRRD